MEFATKNEKGMYESISFWNTVIQTKGTSFITLQAKLGDNEFSDFETIQRGNKVTKIDISWIVNLKLISRTPFEYTIPGLEPRYIYKSKIEDYLYEMTYGNIDYEYANEYFKPSSINGGCSSIRNGGFLGRNFDWLYNNQVQFIVHTPTSENRLAVLGVSGIVPGVLQSNVDQDDIIIEGVDMFKLVPFYLLDGINEKGVTCTYNVVPLDSEDSPTTEIVAKKEERNRVCIPMLPRFILDKFTTAEKALDHLINYTTIYFPQDMIDSGYQAHILLGDTNSSYVLEFINSELKVISGAKYITNFNISDVKFGKNNTIQYPPTNYGVDKYGFGLERWDIITENYRNSNSLPKMRELLEKLKFSNGYGDPFWYSELVKGTDNFGGTITVDTDPVICTTARDTFRENYADRDRDDPKTWITTHSSIYDIGRKILYIKNQEGQTEYKFNI